MCTHIADSLFCIAETSKTLHSNYTLIQKKSLSRISNTRTIFLLKINEGTSSFSNSRLDYLSQLCQQNNWKIWRKHFKYFNTLGITKHTKLTVTNQKKEESRKMVWRNLFAGQQWRFKHSEHTCGHSAGRRGWGELREQHLNTHITMCKTDSQWEFGV